MTYFFGNAVAGNNLDEQVGVFSSSHGAYLDIFSFDCGTLADELASNCDDDLDDA